MGGRWANYRGWIVVAAVSAGLAVALCHLLPPQPRWQMHLQKGDVVLAVEPVHGRIFFRDAAGISALDLASGSQLGQVVVGADFTFHSADRFSPNHRHHVVRFDKGRKLGVVDVVTLTSQVIDLSAIKDNDQTPWLTFAPDSAWLAVGIRGENGPAAVVVVDLVSGKVAAETELKSSFGTFLPGNQGIACETTLDQNRYIVTVWDLATGNKVSSSPPFLASGVDSDNAYRFWPKSWLPDGRTLIACRQSAAGKTELVVWDIVANQLRGLLPVTVSGNSSLLSFAPDGKTLWLTSPDGKKLIFVDPLTAAVRKEHELPASARYTSASSDSTLMVCETEEGSVLFQLPAGEVLAEWCGASEKQWAFAPELLILYRIDFDGEMGHLLLDGVFTFHFRDPYSQRTVSHGPLPTDSCWPPYHQFYPRMMFVRSALPSRTNSVREFLLRWLPPHEEPTSQVLQVDLATGRTLGRLEFPGTPQFKFSEPAYRLVTWYTDRSGGEVVACWDVPFRPSWTWVLGPPLALFEVAAAWRWRQARSLQSR